MTKTSVEETRAERLIRAFLAGADAEMREIRGRRLTATERAEYEAEAVALYGEPTAPPVAAVAA